MAMRALLLRSVCVGLLLPSAAWAQKPPANAVATPPATATAPAAAKSGSAPITRDELPEVLKEVFLADPNLMMDIMKGVHEKQQELAKKEAEESIKKNAAKLFGGDEYPSIGPKDADVTIVEFYDYHCGYCKRMVPTINQLMKEDKKVRIIFRDFPILSEDSTVAARASIAAHRVAPDKFFEFHTAVMKMNAKFTEADLIAAAKKAGIDPKKFKTALDEKETTRLLDANQELAGELGVRGTPAILFPNKLVPGAIPFEDLQRMIDEQRNGGKK